MKLDLETIKEGIDKIKAEKKDVSVKLGESTNALPKDSFLNELISSLDTGRETSSSKLIKMVENKISEKKGEPKSHPLSETKIPRKSNPQQHVQNNNNNLEQENREEQLYKDIENSRKKTLAESLNNLNNNPQTQNSNQQTSPMMNEGFLKENVENIVGSYMTDKFSSIVEETIKSTILEMYTVEKVKEALQENKDMIKKMVIDTIRGLQSKKKKES